MILSRITQITNQELFISNILSVVQKQYTKENVIETTRKEDLFVCVLDGKSLYHFDKEQIALSTGDVIFLPNKCHYRREILSESYRTVLVYFNFTKAPDLSLIPSVFPAIPNIDADFIKLARKWSSRGLCTQIECACQLYNIYINLIHSKTSSYLPSFKRKLFESAIKELTEHYTDENYQLNSLAAQADMSEVHFRRCFKEIYHVSPQQYLMELRLTNAKELLRYDTTPIAEIAQQSGFADPCYFSRLFKHKTDYTPSQYRKLFGAQPF